MGKSIDVMQPHLPKKSEEILRIEKRYNIDDINVLTRLLEVMLRGHKYRKTSINSAKERIKFLTVTLKKCQDRADKLFPGTDVTRLSYGRTGFQFQCVPWPKECVERIFCKAWIEGLIREHKAILKNLVKDLPPLSVLVLNLAYLFKHTDRTTKTPKHIGHVNWHDILVLFLYWRPTIEDYGVVFTEVIPQNFTGTVQDYQTTMDQKDQTNLACNALKKRCKEIERKIEKSKRKEDDFLDPIIKAIVKDREALDRAGNKANKILGKAFSQE